MNIESKYLQLRADVHEFLVLINKLDAFSHVYEDMKTAMRKKNCTVEEIAEILEVNEKVERLKGLAHKLYIQRYVDVE